MSRRRFFVPRRQIHNGTAALSPNQAHHLRNVLRLKAGDELEIFDGEGGGYRGKVEYRGVEVLANALEKLGEPPVPAVPVILAPALIKADRFEWVLQKATELGVAEFIPVISRFSEIRIPESKTEARLERWVRIIEEATRQCGGLSIPRIRRPLHFSRFLTLDEYPDASRLLFYEHASLRWRGEIPLEKPVLVCIGPEGGWHPEEVEAASGAGFQIFGLGHRILRAETAAIAAVTLVQFQIMNGGL